MKWFCFINFLLAGIFRASVKLFSYHRLTPLFGMPYQNCMLSTCLSKEALVKAKAIQKSIRIVSKQTPWKTTCLTQALLARFWCGWFNIPYVFYIGFKKDPDSADGFRAHAWVSAGPLMLCGGDGFTSFHVTSCYLPKHVAIDICKKSTTKNLCPQ